MPEPRSDSEGPAARPSVLMAAPDPVHPGGITRLIDAWEAGGLGRRVDLRRIHTSRWDDPPPRQALQALAALASLTGALVRSRPDVVHLHASVGGSLIRKALAIVICRLLAVPAVVQLHSGTTEAVTARRGVQRTAARTLARLAEVVIVPAERWRPLAQRLGSKRCEVVPNCIAPGDRERFEAARDERAAAAGRPDPPTLLFYGRWAPVKGLDRLAGALAGIDASDYRLRVFGNGDRAWAERALAPLGERASIAGWIGLDRKASELAAASAYVLPSRAEAFAQSLLDAQAAGVPIIASDTGAVAEVLDGYEPKLLVDPEREDELAAALARLISGEWPPRGVEPAPLAPRFRAERATDSLVGIYERVGGNPARASA